MEWTDPRRTPFVPVKCRGDLPHLYKPGAIYFVTFRMADAVVTGKSGRRTDSSIGGASADDPDPHELLRDYDPPLTLGSGALRRPEVGSLVHDALLYFDGQRYSLGAWCVMPNHVHVVFAPEVGHSPAEIMQSWKGFTARAANKILGKTGPFWERESFDHLVRSIRSLERLGSYVEWNPVEAGLSNRPEDWPYSSAGVGYSSTFWRR